MTDFSRRAVLKASAASALLGLSGSLAFMPAAQAADIKKKGFYSFKVGTDIEVISIYDGVWQKGHDPNFAVGATLEDQKAALRSAGLTDEFVPIDFAFTVVKSKGKTILIDAGTGGQLAPTAGQAKAGLKAAGINNEDVDLILISHMHPDHIFGLMEKETNAQVFSNAEIMVGESEYKFWTDPATINKVPERRKPLINRIQATFPTWKNVTLFKDNATVADGIQAHPTPGHSPGHTAFHVSSGNDQTMIIGDAIIVPALFLANIDWQLVFDADKDLATKTRKSLLDRVIADNMTIAGYHFGFPNSGKLTKDGKSYVFNPATA
ncbi:MAG: MBL fold metallo-hydrolase [Pseudomonadota bacterium]